MSRGWQLGPNMRPSSRRSKNRAVVGPRQHRRRVRGQRKRTMTVIYITRLLLSTVTTSRLMHCI